MMFYMSDLHGVILHHVSGDIVFVMVISEAGCFAFIDRVSGINSSPIGSRVFGRGSCPRTVCWRAINHIKLCQRGSAHVSSAHWEIDES